MSVAGKISPALGVMFLLLALAGTGCAATLKGQVVDAQTGKPIAGAVILGIWTKYVGPPGLESGRLVGVKETEADAEGRFVLETLAGEESVTVYKFGYVAWNNLFTFPTSARRADTSVPARILLERFPPGQSHQRHMDFVDDARRSATGYGRSSIPKFWDSTRREREMR